MAISKVALLGANGTLGPSVLNELLAASFTVTVLKRASSHSPDNYPKGVLVAQVPDDMDVDTLSEILRGQDALVATIKGSQTEVQDKLGQACVNAGVYRMIPADFGSCDSSSQWTQDLVPLYKHKTALRERLTKLAEQNDGFTWTSLVCGHFFDWDPGFLHIYPKEQRVDIIDDGETKWSASTLSQIGKATARILQNPEETKNQAVYVQSFCISQNEVTSALEKATSSIWKTTKFDSKQYEKEEKAKADGGDLEAIENLVWMLGALDANWEQRDGFAMKKLGLEPEDLQNVVDRMVEDWSQSESA